MFNAPLIHISLFSGYAGFDLALKLTNIPFRTVLYVEMEPYCQEIIRQRIRDGYLDDAPIWPDVRTLDGRPFAGKVGLITAGFPCQPHSFAGKRRGEADERNLWPDTLTLIREVAPGYVLLENVPGIIANGYAGTVIGQLSEIGYDCIWDCVPAASVGAPHLRWRWWCLAYPNNKGLEGRKLLSKCASQRAAGPGGVAYAQGEQGRRLQQPGLQADAGADSWWEVEPDVGRVVDGCSSRVDRLKALGNGIVPAVVRKFLVSTQT